MLFDPDRHEPLSTAAWDPARVREGIVAIVRDLEQGRAAGGQWPVHPLDDEGDEPPGGFKDLYLGSAGVLWALWYLEQRGAVRLALDPRGAIEAVCADGLHAPDGGPLSPSYFLGAAGILLVRHRLTGAADAAEQLVRSVRANLTNPANELLYGCAGTTLAALHLFRIAPDERFRALFLEGAQELRRSWTFDFAAGCHLWVQDLGGPRRHLGAAHGAAGNVLPLLAGAALLDAGRREELYDRCAAAFRGAALAEDGAVNWPTDFGPVSAGGKRLLQWCHGAPGIVTALAPFPRGRSPELDALLTGAGEAIWRAGPLTKGPGLCHGSAGNGAAFLALHLRTGEARWLERARAFAMHALEQQERLRRTYGRPRATLWTGDAGLAVYLWQCLQGIAGLPLLDLI